MVHHFSTAREIKLPRKVPKEHVYLTHQQVHDLANASGDRAPIILLLCYAGLRWAEMVGLRVKDIDFERRRIRVSENAVEVNGIIEVGTPRHTAASFAVSAGANVKAIQRMLGHASAAMTLDIYADRFDDDLDREIKKTPGIVEFPGVSIGGDGGI